MKQQRSYFLFCVSIICLFGGISQLRAQSSSFLGDGTQDLVRRQQLLGKVDQKNGLLMQSFSSVYNAMDSLLPAWGGKNKNGLLKGSPVKIQWLPLSFGLVYKGHHPYGSNDGVMIPAAGGQTMISGGLSIEAGHFSVQLKPEFVYAGNKSFETFPEEHYDVYWAQYYKLLNTIDMPERFGNTSYNKIFAGQSSIRYNTGAYSVGLSTENIWWGPGRYNALVMSNNAPGFEHITFNTTRPVETGIGSFEGQLIAGRLTSSGIYPPDTNRYYNGVRLYHPKNEESRYLAGFMFSWQPKWVKGLFIGATKASYLYQSDMSGIADIFPLEGIIRSSSEKSGKKASLGSIFARYVMPEEKAELYFEFGRNDKSPSVLNVITDDGYPKGYVAGFRKLFTARKHYIEFAAEITQLQLPTAELVAQSISFYTHPYVRQGFTNQGQVLGSGIGPGSNSQLIDISWIKGFTKVGLKFERIMHNNDFYYNSFVAVSDFTRHWVDISTTLHADWQYKRFLLSGKMGLIRSLNYQWYIFPDLGYFKNGYDVLNFHGALNVSYRL